MDLRKIRKELIYPFCRIESKRLLQKFHEKPRTLKEVVDAAMDFGGHGYLRVKTMQVRSEILQLAEMVAEIQPKTILEIGTHRGGTLFIWAHLASELVVSCDINDMRRQEWLFTKFPPPSSRCEVKLLSGNSHDPAFFQRVRNVLAERQVDFLFIDGDHTEEGVSQDYQMYKDLVRPGGLIAFHDIVDNQPYETNQVQFFWKKLKKIADVVEIIENPNQTGFGVGVLRVPAEGAPDLH